MITEEDRAIVNKIFERASLEELMRITFSLQTIWLRGRVIVHNPSKYSFEPFDKDFYPHFNLEGYNDFDSLNKEVLK